MISVIFLQKFGVPVGAGVVIPIGLFLTYLVSFALIKKSLGQLNSIRLGIFLIFLAAGLLNLLLRPAASVSSFCLVAVLAFTFVIEIPVDRDVFIDCMRFFVGAMLLTSPIIVTEWSLQLIFRPGVWIDVDAWVSKLILVPGYMYYHPTAFDSPWMQPNAAIFLEVSILSQFLAIALILEIAYFMRPFVLATLFATMMITFGGSGPFLLVLSAPFIAFHLPRKLLVSATLFVFFTIAILSLTSIFSDFSGRIEEFSNPQGSAHGRYVVPFRVMTEELFTDGGLFYGHGPGTGDNAGAGFSLGKLLYEYGLLGTVAYSTLCLHMIINSGHKFLVGWTLSIFLAFLGGGLGVPLYPLAFLVLGGFLSVRRESVR